MKIRLEEINGLTLSITIILIIYLAIFYWIVNLW